MESLQELMAKATPLPWRVDGQNVLKEGLWHGVARTDGWHSSTAVWEDEQAEQMGSAALIVRAVNALPETLALLEAAREIIGDSALNRAVEALERVLEGGEA